MGELLSLRGVSRWFMRGDRRLPVLANVTLEVGAREIVAVAGARGCGKTTLLRVAAGLDRPDAGEVWFCGQELTGLASTRRVRLFGREVAWTATGDAGRSRLLGSEIAWTDRGGPGTRLQVRDFVGLPLALGRRRRRSEARGLAQGALERVGAADCADQHWEDLCNWERVLVGLARGVVSRPRLLVIDDLLDGLGAQAVKQVGDLLCSLVDELGCGVLLSAPDLDAALAADRVWSFTHEGLELMSDQTGVGDAEVIDFPRVARRRGVGL